MSDGTSVGKIQLDVEISKSSISKELQGLNKIIGTGLQGSMNAFSSQMQGFVKKSIGSMFSGFKAFGQKGKAATKEVAESADNAAAKIEALKAQMDNASNSAEFYRQKMKDLQSQYDRLSNANMGDTAKAKKFQEQILKSESAMLRFANVSDKARLSIEKIEQSMDKAAEAGEKADNSVQKAGHGIKLFGDNAKKTEKKVGGLAAAINRSLMTVLRRMFIYNLIYKGLRGLISYMNGALKTNKQFTSSLNTVRTNLRVAFQPIYDFILPAIQALMRAVATASTYMASVISSLFGKSYKESYDAAKGIENAKKSMDGYGDSAKKAKGQVMGFDEVNVLDEDGGASGFEMEMPDTSTIDLTGFEKFKKILKPTIASLENLGVALKPLRNFVSDSLKDFYNNFLVPVGRWTFGEGLPRFINAITNGLSKINWKSIKDGLNNLWSSLTPFAINIGEGLLWFWERVLVPFSTWVWNEIVSRFLNIFAESFRVLNSVIEALKPLGMWLWDSFLQPLASWTGGVIVSVLDGITRALKGISDWIRGNQQTIENMAIVIGSFMTAWTIVDLAVKIGGIVSALVTFVTTGGLAAAVATALGAAIAFITSPITLVALGIGALIAAIVLLIKHWDEVKVAAAQCWEWIKEKWKGAGEWFSQAVVEPVKALFSELWSNIKIKASEAWEGVKGIWYAVGTWFNNTVITPVSTFFSNLRDSIKNALSTAWTWVQDVWKGAGEWFKSIGENMFNGMWEGLKSIWKNIESWINSTIDWLEKKLTFWKKSEETMSSSGGSSGGGGGGSGPGSEYQKNKQAEMTANRDEIAAISKTKDVDMDTAWNMWKANSIPKLARGGIVDQPTLAMIGERGKEAVVPLENTSFIDKLASALANVLMMALNTGNTQQSSSISDAIVNIDGTELARILIPKVDNELRRMGYRGILQTT